MKKDSDGQLETLVDSTNGAEESIRHRMPYVATITVEGTSAILFHRWNVEGIEEKGKAPKGSDAKKTDDVKSYVWRDEKGEIAIPGEYFRQSIIGAAKYRQDPRSPRKSAMDLFKAGIVVLDEYCSLGSKDWDYLDRRRVTVMRAGITRARPAFMAGWRTTMKLTILLPEYIPPRLLNDVIRDAGELVGVADNRPSYGRFQITRFETNERG